MKTMREKWEEKILIITASLNERSGWGRHTRAIVDELRVRGVEVIVYSEIGATDISYPVYPLLPLSSRFAVWSFIKNIRIVRRAAKSVSVVHALDGWPLGIYGWCAIIGRRKSLFINGVGTYSVAPLFSLVKKWFMLSAYRRSKKIFCISAYTLNKMAQAGVPREKMTIVHFGIPALASPDKEEIENIYTKYTLKKDHYPIILTVGSIKDRKGQFDTLRAIGLVKNQYPNILYIVAGSADQPSYITKMKQYAEEHSLNNNLLFITDADDQIISFLYSICTVFALNSNTDEHNHHFEGFGAVITEAYQFGIPAVGSRDSGIEDAIQDGKTGYLTLQDNAGDIAEKIEKVLQNHSVLSEQAKRFSSDFSWKKTVETYMQYYK